MQVWNETCKYLVCSGLSLFLFLVEVFEINVSAISFTPFWNLIFGEWLKKNEIKNIDFKSINLSIYIMVLTAFKRVVLFKFNKALWSLSINSFAGLKMCNGSTFFYFKTLKSWVWMTYACCRIITSWLCLSWQWGADVLGGCYFWRSISHITITYPVCTPIITSFKFIA